VGDAGLSNVLGKVVFTVVAAGSKNATVGFSPASQVYLNDGAGTLATLTTKSSVITLSPTPTLKDNQWLTEVGQDTTPPQPFVVQVESTSGVFDGQYYAVFSTTDKESGLDHFEIHEGNGWKHVTSPYQLKNQSLLGVGDIQIRAVDKAGNMRMGEYSASKTPKRLLTYKDWLPFILFGIIVLIGAIVWYFDHKKARSMHPPTA
jgi:hypothetical protein